MSKLKNLFLTSVICLFLAEKAMGGFASECQFSNPINSLGPGVVNCLQQLAYLKLTGQDINHWCSTSDNSHHCCLTCQNYKQSSSSCQNIAYNKNCEDKASMGQCNQIMANSLPVSYFCAKSCGKCQSKLSCSTLATGCNGGQCYDVHYFSQESVRCVCPPNKGGQYCQSENLCYQNPCLNNGECTATYEPLASYTCTCKHGYFGKNCQYMYNLGCVNGKECYNDGVCQINPFTGVKACQCKLGYTGQNCESYIGGCVIDKLCLNGGSCIPTTNNPLYYCICKPGFKGPRCETEDKCSKVVCQNHGKCRESISGGSPYCECQSGFTGANCETKINGCTVNPCQNKGNCFALTGMDYFCICPQYTSGSQCQFYNPGCSNYACLNGGTCFLNVHNQPECSCQTGYTGKFCGTYVETCNSCFNGGTCTRKNGVDTCSCPPTYYGTRCEYSPNCNRGDNNIQQCQTWSKQGFCDMKFTYNGMPVPIHCPISCNLCNLQCYDSLNECDQWSKQGLCEAINQQNNGMCRKSCSQCYYPFMKIFSTVTNQTLPQKPMPVEEWTLEHPLKDLSADLETTTLKPEESKNDTVITEEPKEESKLNFI